jgi:hypothetical protein
LIIHLPEWWHPQQCLAPTTPLHHSQFNHFLNHPQVLGCCQDPVSPLFFLLFLSKASNYSVTSCQQPAICASCRQYSLWKTSITAKVIHHN